MKIEEIQESKKASYVILTCTNCGAETAIRKTVHARYPKQLRFCDRVCKGEYKRRLDHNQIATFRHIKDNPRSSILELASIMKVAYQDAMNHRRKLIIGGFITIANEVIKPPTQADLKPGLKLEDYL